MNSFPGSTAGFPCSPRPESLPHHPLISIPPISTVALHPPIRACAVSSDAGSPLLTVQRSGVSIPCGRGLLRRTMLLYFVYWELREDIPGSPVSLTSSLCLTQNRLWCLLITVCLKYLVTFTTSHLPCPFANNISS